MRQVQLHDLPSHEIITKSHGSFFLRFTILAHGNGPVRGRGSICTYSYRFFPLDGKVAPQGKTSLSAAAIRADDFIPMTERDPQIFRFGLVPTTTLPPFAVFVIPTATF